MVRIDKFLWAVRLFKTRSLSSQACRKGKILMDEITVKPSKMIKSGDEFKIKDGPIYRKYLVLDLAEKRMGAKLTPDFIKEITAAEDLELYELTRLANKMNRQRGTGRPTKKERRDLDSFFENSAY